MDPHSTVLTDKFLLYLIKRSISQFKELFPEEEPYIKVICMRDKRLTKDRIDKNESWRSTIVKNYDDVELLKDDDKIKLRTLKRTKLIHEEKIKITNVTEDVNSVSSTQSIKTDKENVRYERPRLTKQMKKDGLKSYRRERITEEHEETYEKTIDIAPLNIQVEIIKDDPAYKGHFIKCKTTEHNLSITDTSVDSIKPLSNIVVCQNQEFFPTEEQLSKLIEQTTLDELKECSMMIKENFKRDMTVKEVMLKYIENQKRLNNLQSQIQKYTYGFRDWEKIKAEKGFVLSLVDLVHFWWNLVQDLDD
jgi:hypothetical protein